MTEKPPGLLAPEYARLLGVTPDAGCSELAAAAVRLGGFQLPQRQETRLLLCRCIRDLERFCESDASPLLLEALMVGALDSPAVRGVTSLEALVGCAVDLGVIAPEEAATAGYVHPEFGATVLALDDALDHLAARVGDRIATADVPPDPSWVQHVELELVDFTDGIPTYADRCPSEIFATVAPSSSVRPSPVARLIMNLRVRLWARRRLRPDIGQLTAHRNEGRFRRFWLRRR